MHRLHPGPTLLESSFSSGPAACTGGAVLDGTAAWPWRLSIQIGPVRVGRDHVAGAVKSMGPGPFHEGEGRRCKGMSGSECDDSLSHDILSANRPAPLISAGGSNVRE